MGLAGKMESGTALDREQDDLLFSRNKLCEAIVVNAEQQESKINKASNCEVRATKVWLDR